MSKILIRRLNGSQREGSRTPRPERDCVPLGVLSGSFDDTSVVDTNFLNFESLFAIIFFLSRLGGGGNVVDVHVVHD